MIVTKGLGSNRLITSGFGWKFGYAEAIPTISPGGLGGGGLPWNRLGYVPYNERPPSYVMPQARRPRRPRPPEPDIPSEIVDVAGVALDGLSLGMDVEKSVPDGLSILGEPSPAAGPAQVVLGQASGSPQERRGWSTGAKVALAVGAVGTAGLCVAAGYLIGRRLRAKDSGNEDTGFCCGSGQPRRSSCDVRAPRKADRPRAEPRPRSRKRRKGGG